jgi:hypothetical protein
MRGHRERSGSLFFYVSIEERILAGHPLRRIRKLADQALDRLNPTFCELYAAEKRSSVPLEQLLLASLLQAFSGCARSVWEALDNWSPVEAVPLRQLGAPCSHRCRWGVVQSLLGVTFHAGESCAPTATEAGCLFPPPSCRSPWLLLC